MQEPSIVEPLFLPKTIPVIYRILPFSAKLYQKRFCNQQLHLRTKMIAVEKWDKKISYSRISRISQVIAECCEWTNSYFIPQDPCTILFWDDDPGLDSGIAIGNIGKILNPHKEGNLYLDVFLPFLENRTYGDLICHLDSIGLLP